MNTLLFIYNKNDSLRTNKPLQQERGKYTILVSNLFFTIY